MRNVGVFSFIKKTTGKDVFILARHFATYVEVISRSESGCFVIPGSKRIRTPSLA